MNFAAFLRSQFSESDGTVSNTRVSIFVVIAFASGWITALVVKVPRPVLLPELGAFVGQLGLYVTGICTTLYAVNKAADVLNHRAPATPGASGQSSVVSGQ
jgi:hypothetical protein